MKTPELLSQMGAAALLPGLQHALDMLNTLVAEYRGFLAQHQMSESLLTGVKRRGRPPGRPNKVATITDLTKAGKPLKGSYWANLTPAQRSAEMKRRMRVTAGLEEKRPRKASRKAKTSTSNHPRNPDHPEHAAWAAKLKAANAEWRRKNPGQAKANLKKAVKARIAANAQRVNGAAHA
jgi:hypothetical protein